jgi:hypothetical protein
MPELRRADNDKPLIGGRFVLCVLREGISAMDLDNGTLISSDDPDADILLGASQSTLDGTISYYAAAINNAKIDEIESSSITYELCKDIVLSLSRPGIFIVDEGALACVLTTQKQIVLVRAESVDTFGGETVEFSFAILRE